MRKIPYLFILFSFFIGFLFLGGAALGEKAALPRPLVIDLTLDGPISAPAASYIARGVDEAEKEDARLIVLKLNTPGGAGDAMLKIIASIDNSTIPVCVYVSPRGAMAASAGMYITESAQIAAMAPQTTIGAAHPVSAGGGSIQGDEREKITNTFVATVKTHASRYGRNVRWVEEAVRKSISATEDEAVKLKVVDLKATSLDDLLVQLDGRRVKVLNRDVILHTKNAEVREVQMSFVENFLMTITHPEIVLILFMLGTYGLLYELMSPGAILPGVVGAICLLLAFYAMGTLPVNYAGVFLILLSFVLFILDIKIQAHGVLTVGGVVSLAFGSLLLIESGGGYTKTYYAVVATTILFTLTFVFLVLRKVMQTWRMPQVVGKEGMIGKIGTVKTRLSPEGYVAMEGSYWKATSADGYIEEGEKVCVVKVENLTLHVKKAGPN